MLEIADQRSIRDDFLRIPPGARPAAKGNAIEELLTGLPPAILVGSGSRRTRRTLILTTGGTVALIVLAAAKAPPRRQDRAD